MVEEVVGTQEDRVLEYKGKKVKIFFVIVFICLSFITLNAEDVKSSTDEVQIQEHKLEKVPSYVTVMDVTEKSVFVFSKVQEIEKELQESQQVKDMYAALPAYVKTVELLLHQEEILHQENQSIRNLQKVRSELAIHLKQFSEWESAIKDDIEKYNKYRVVIKAQVKLWDESYLHVTNEKAPDSIKLQVLSVLNELNRVDNNLKSKYDHALTSSQLITTNILKLTEINESLLERERVSMNKVFFKNQDSFFELLARETLFISSYANDVVKVILEKYDETLSYFLTNSDLWIKLSIISFASFIFVTFYNFLYRKKRLFVREASLKKKIFFFIGRPFATYAILFVLGVTFVFASKPTAMKELISLFIFIPVIRILQTVIPKKLYRYLYSMFGFWFLLWIAKNSIDFELQNRLIMLVLSFSLILYTVEILYKKILNVIAHSYIQKIARYLLTLFAFLLVVAIGSNLYGSVLLSSRIVEGVISTYYSAMIFYALYVILTGYIVVILRRRMASASNMLDIYAQKIEKTTSFLIKAWMLLWWLLIIVKQVSLYPYILEFKDAVLAFSFTIAETTISINSLFNFVFIVFGTWLLANLTKTILEVEVFARFKLPRGAPTAILTTLNYIIIISGTIIAFSSLGVSPQQFALVFGALGVGIGFGLRNIIANFVSGIIMVFERPIQIGDTIEVDKTMGTVQCIGARSSTVKTFDGSEVIIPNADFIAKEITNWTLSDEHRRKTVEFKVDLDNDIDIILKIMQEVAESHPNVLIDPKPLATFKSFGEYYLEFKLYFWLSENLIVAQSEVNIGVYKALKKAGVTMPVPKTNLTQAL